MHVYAFSMGDNALPQRSIYKWIEMFKKGQTSVMDAEHSGRPSTSATDEKLEAVLVLPRAYP